MNKIEQIKELKLLFESRILNQEQYTKLLNEIVEKPADNSDIRFEDNVVQKDTQIKSDEKIQDYKSVIIGNQEWMSENLKLKTFRNGDVIIEASNYDDWIGAIKSKTPAWCYYDDDPIHSDKKGLLYNFYAVHDSRGLAPFGWQVPTYDDFKILLKNTDERALKSREDWHHLEEILLDKDNIDFDDDKSFDIKQKILDEPINYWKLNKNSGENGTNKSGFNLKPSGYYYIGDNEDLFRAIDTDSVLWIYNNLNKFIYNHKGSFYITNKLSLIRNYSYKDTFFNNYSGYALRCIKKEDNLPLIDYSNIDINIDSLFERAAMEIIFSQKASSSQLQRELKIGYNRAEKLIDQLETAGIVGSFNGSRAREVLFKNNGDYNYSGNIITVKNNPFNKIVEKSENAIEVKLWDNGLKIIKWLKIIGQEISFSDSLFTFEIDGVEMKETEELDMSTVLFFFRNG